MKKSTLLRHMLASFLFSVAFLSFTTSATAQCNTLAYAGVAPNGNQNYPQRLGLIFNVNSPITITALGVYDDAQNGISSPIQVGIVTASDGSTVVGPISISGTSDPLEAKHRVRAITPVILPVGQYQVVAIGFNDVDQNGNNAIAGYPPTDMNSGGGLISFIGAAYGGVGFGPATVPDENTYHAGTFKFSPVSVDTDGDGIGDACDTDDDNDGILDANDNCPLIANANQADNDHDGIGDACDTDDDNDGVLDVNDNCPLVANPNQADNDLDGIGDICDPDDDNDGVLDVNDNCPFMANPNQADADHDGIGDVCDSNTIIDTDGDGIPDASDNCPTVANANQADNDHDGIGDVCDPDDDNDGILDVNDNCRTTANANQADNDHDGIGDVCDTDDDNDGVLDVNDNCPLVANPNQADADHDGIGDVCDTSNGPDTDGDGVPDAKDNCPNTYNPNQADNDHDGKGDVCDPDDDNDCRPDVSDNCPFTFNPFQFDVDHDGLGDRCDPDDDNDGVLDVNDNCRLIVNPNQADLDHDGIGDACDLDIDGDGVLNIVDCAPLDKKNNKWVVCHKGQTLCVEQNTVISHLLHGDYLGSCRGSSTAMARTAQEKTPEPENLTLSNYPNPFSKTTRIAYDLPVDGKVSLKVYDNLGRLVATLVEGDKKAGSYTVDFDASKAGSGNYYSRIIVTSKDQQLTKTGTMIRLK